MQRFYVTASGTYTYHSDVNC